MSISIGKLAVAVTLGALMASGAVFAQGGAVEEAAEEAVEEAVAEEVAAPAPVPEPAVVALPAPVVEVSVPVAVEVKPPKPETKVDFYGTASYRFRGRIWNANASGVEVKKNDTEKKSNDYGRTEDKDVTVYKDSVVSVKTTTKKVDKEGSSFDYLNLLGWSFGAKVKVDDQLSLQFQIGNDVTSGESVSWWNNKAPQARSYIAGADNLYVHLAYAAYNPGPISLIGGVIPVSSNGTLDLLERSLSTGSYGDAIFQTWSTQLNNSLIGIKLGVPIVKDGVKVSAELTSSVIEPRTQTLISGIGTTGTSSVDQATGIEDVVAANPTSLLFILDIPVAAGDFKVTPQITSVLNRNYNSKLEKGDHEFLGGLSAGYKLSDQVSLSLNGAYGTVSNENSLVGGYGNNSRSGTGKEIAALSTTENTYTYKSNDTVATTVKKDVKISYANSYVSNGLLLGVGANIKVGPGAFALGVSYGNSYNGAEAYTDTTKTTNTTVVKDTVGAVLLESKKTGVKVDSFDPKTLTNKNDILIDLRYTWNIHPKFSIAPRWRTYITTYDEGSKHVELKMENRPEVVLTGTF